jgi:hypothetical protein
MHQLQRSWVRSQHPSAQWNLRGGRWSSAEYSTKEKEKIPQKNIRKKTNLGSKHVWLWNTAVLCAQYTLQCRYNQVPSCSFVQSYMTQKMNQKIWFLFYEPKLSIFSCIKSIKRPDSASDSEFKQILQTMQLKKCSLKNVLSLLFSAKN